MIRGEDGRISRVRYVLPRHKAASWVGSGRGRKSTRPGASGVAPSIPLDTRIDGRIRARFPYDFTAAQSRVCAEIAADMARPEPMNRLLQWDVGSGKTAVALYLLLATSTTPSNSSPLSPTV